MATDAPTLTVDLPKAERTSGSAPVTALVLAWSKDEPGRVGEIALMPGGYVGARVRLGRAGPQPGETVPRAELVRQRPGATERTGPLRSPQLSREQLHLEAAADGALLVENIGRATLLHNGRPVTTARVVPGDVLELAGVAVFRSSARPYVLAAPAPGAAAWPSFRFGAADAFGLVGESPGAWELRHQVAFIAPRATHVLVRGPSGSGKELVAQAIHALSPRGSRRLVARNAATIPESLIDAELFGNARNYPNPGMAERVGLVGEADGSTLFLDEFGELPPAAQAHLLRVLDEGEYHRLGDARSRRADIRLVAATNRPEDALKEDVSARLRLRIEVPGLDGRRDDIPLLVRHLLSRIARGDPALAAQWFPDGDPTQPPRVTAALISALLRRPFRTHVRELEGLLWRALSRPGAALDVWEGLNDPIEEDPEPAEEERPADAVDPLSIPPDVIQEVLDRHQGRQSDAWRELGFSSRHVLARLVKRYGLIVRRPEG